MNRFFINVSNEQTFFPVNDSDFENTGIKMMEYILNKTDLVNLSALADFDVKNLIFNVDITITEDEEIQKLNQQYRNKNEPTDVLSFALFSDNPECQIVVDDTIYLGDIIISLQTANKQANENNKTLEEEVNFLISHGLLHLLGFDHDTDEKLEFMINIQNDMLKSAVKVV